MDTWSLGCIALELFFDWEFLQTLKIHLEEISIGSGAARTHDAPCCLEEWKNGKINQLKYGHRRETTIAHVSDRDLLLSNGGQIPNFMQVSDLKGTRVLNSATGSGPNAEIENPAVTDPQRHMDLLLKTGVERLRWRILELIGGEFSDTTISSEESDPAATKGRSRNWRKYENFLEYIKDSEDNNVMVPELKNLFPMADRIVDGLYDLLSQMLQVNPRFRSLPDLTDNYLCVNSDSFLYRHNHITESSFFQLREANAFKLQRAHNDCLEKALVSINRTLREAVAASESGKES